MSELRRHFDSLLVNGVHGDPCLHLVDKSDGRGLLFDLGNLQLLPKKLLGRIKFVMISHMHMDHFYGFDRLLRANITRRGTLHLFGPAQLAQSVSYKIRAYTWNLIESDQIQYLVTEISDDRFVKTFCINKSSDFVAVEVSDVDSDVFDLDDHLSLNAVSLDHNGIDSVAYQLRKKLPFKINADSLKRAKFEPGPWLSKMQSQKSSDADLVEVSGQLYPIGDLRAKLTESQADLSMVYLTDIAFSASNVAKLSLKFQSTQTMFCETSFMNCDLDRAVAKAHLTTKQGALLACLLGASNFEAFHFSSIYKLATDVAEEAKRWFTSFHGYDKEKIKAEVDQQLQQIALV